MKPIKGGQKVVESLLKRPDVQEALYKSGTMTEKSPLYKNLRKKYGSVKDSKGKSRFPEFAGETKASQATNLKRTV